MGRSKGAITSAFACAAIVLPCRAAAASMDYLHADGLQSARILPLTWGLLIISAAVVVIIAALVLIAIVRRARGGPVAGTAVVEGDATGWISIGVGLSTVVLVGLVIWTSVTMAGIASPPSKPALSIEVRGHQWWWEFAYLNDNPSKTFVTAKRDSHSSRRAGAICPRGRRRHPHVLGAEPRRKDSAYSGPNKPHLARGG